MKVIAIIQARMSASRLPGKVLLDIHGKPMLQWVVERTQRAESIDQVVVATTADPSDDPVAEFCQDLGYAISRGSIHDVLDRYFQAAKAYQADVIVRITADCPLIDPELIDQVVISLSSSMSDTGSQTAAPLDFIANRLPQPWWRSFPIGLDTEVFTFGALERAWKDAMETHQREHVTPFFYDDIPTRELHFSANQGSLAAARSPRGFVVGLLHYDEELGHHRWTVDTPEDLEFVRQVVAHLPGENFTWLDVLELVEKNPDLAQINAQIEHKTHLDVDKRA